LDGKEGFMGFADVTLQIRQMSGKAYPLQIEMGCFSFDTSEGAVPTRLTHVIGGLTFGCLTAGGCIGKPKVGSVCEGGFVAFTVNGTPDLCMPYIVAGW